MVKKLAVSLPSLSLMKTSSDVDVYAISASPMRALCWRTNFCGVGFSDFSAGFFGSSAYSGIQNRNARARSLRIRAVYGGADASSAHAASAALARGRADEGDRKSDGVLLATTA